MTTYLLTLDEGEALSFCRSAGISEREAVIVRSSAELLGRRFDSSDLILQFYSFKDHPDRANIEGELLVKLAHFGKGPKPQWVRAGQ